MKLSDEQEQELKEYGEAYEMYLEARAEKQNEFALAGTDFSPNMTPPGHPDWFADWVASTEAVGESLYDYEGDNDDDCPF